MPIRRRILAPSIPTDDEATVPDAQELVIDATTGRVRQAGAVQDEGPWVIELRKKAERSLYVFTKAILKRDLLSPKLHGWFCKSLEGHKPRRRMRLIPRGHLKCLRKSWYESVQHRIQANLDDDWKVRTSTYKVEKSGARATIIGVTSKTGRYIEVTANHPVMTWEGWKRADELSVGDWVAVPRKQPFGKWSNPALAAVFGYMIGDGSCSRMAFTSFVPARRKEFIRLVKLAGGDASEPASGKQYVNVRKMRPIFREAGLEGKRSFEKFVPACILNADEESVRAFLVALFDCDATDKSGKQGCSYATISWQLASDVQHLLLKFGLNSTVQRIYHRTINWYVSYNVQFTDDIGLWRQQPSQRFQWDVFPPQWRAALKYGDGFRLRNARVRVDNDYATSRDKVRKVAEILGDGDLLHLTESDVGWEPIKWVQNLGEDEIVTVESDGTHTLLIGDIVTHNSSIVSESLPMHMHIQPDPDQGTNIYWPGLSGDEMNIILCGEKKGLMSPHLRWIETQWESNKLLRALWPHRCWEVPSRDSKKWNEEEMIIPRGKDYADPSIRVIGVDGAITGAHARVLLKDDLISIEAANSTIVMQRAIDWHIASRALLAPFEDIGLEFTIGTRWAASDLYSYIQANDPSVQVEVRAIIEGGLPIWPEQITPQHIDDLKKEYGVLFALLYMNSAADPSLVDFDVNDLREYTWDQTGQIIRFGDDVRDEPLAERIAEPKKEETDNSMRGVRLTREVMQQFVEGGRGEYFRFKAR